MNNEKINKATELQALHMAKYADINLTREQVTHYAEFRQGIFKRSLPEETVISSYTYDQELLSLILKPEQRVVFESCYPNIFQSSDNSRE